MDATSGAFGSTSPPTRWQLSGCSLRKRRASRSERQIRELAGSAASRKQRGQSREPELERELERREEIEWIVQCVCGSAGAANRPKRLFLPTSSAAVWLTGRRLCGRRPLGAKPSHWLSLSSSTLLSSSKRRVNKPDSAECHFGSRDLARCDVARRGRCLLSAVRFRVSLDELEMGDRRISAARTQTKSLDHRTASSTRLKLRVNR